MSSEDKPLAPGLYLVATPIGNLEDITLRALRVLQSVDRIACEDTRQTQKLLNHFDIKKPTVSYHVHNEDERAEELMAELKAGGRIAVVSDAGTPGIADPGGQIVAAAIAAGVPVFPVPGANAAISALIASGLPGRRVSSFMDFCRRRRGSGRRFWKSYKQIPPLRSGMTTRDPTHVFYDSPQRIVETLADVEASSGLRMRVVVARELTKLHEEFLRGTVARCAQRHWLRERACAGRSCCCSRGSLRRRFGYRVDCRCCRGADEAMAKREGCAEAGGEGARTGQERCLSRVAARAGRTAEGFA